VRGTVRTGSGPGLVGAFGLAGLLLVLPAAPAWAAARVDGMLPTAVRQFKAGQYRVARATFERAVAQAPRDAALYQWLARCDLQLGNDDAAIDEAQEAVALAPGSSEYHRWLGRAYGEKADRTRSFWLARKVKSEFEDAIRLDPSNIAARRDALDFYLNAPWIVGGGRDKAQAEVKAIAALNPVEGDLARAEYLAQDRPQEAAVAYQRALALKPSQPAPYFEAAAFYAGRNNGAALALVVSAAEGAVPADPRIDYYRGVEAALSGRQLASGEAALRAYLHRAPDADDMPSAASAHLWLGRLYERADRPSAAVAEYLTVLKLDPGRRAARDALRRLRPTS